MKNNTDRKLFEAFLSGYDLGYEDGENKIKTDGVSNAVRYVRNNFNEDFDSK